MSSAVGPIPDPVLYPTVSVEEAAQWVGLGRSAAYEAVRRGELPALHFGRTLRVPTALLRQMLGLSVSEESCDQVVTSAESVPLDLRSCEARGTDNRTPQVDETTRAAEAVATLHALRTML